MRFYRTSLWFECLNNVWTDLCCVVFGGRAFYVKISLELQLLLSGVSGHNNDRKCSKCGVYSSCSFRLYAISLNFHFISPTKWKGLRTMALCLLPIPTFVCLLNYSCFTKFSQLMKCDNIASNNWRPLKLQIKIDFYEFWFAGFISHLSAQWPT